MRCATSSLQSNTSRVHSCARTVVRVLDEAGIAVDSLELVRPTLDDVFVEKTGYHLEEESEENAEKAPVEA